MKNIPTKILSKNYPFWGGEVRPLSHNLPRGRHLLHAKDINSFVSLFLLGDFAKMVQSHQSYIGTDGSNFSRSGCREERALILISLPTLLMILLWEGSLPACAASDAVPTSSSDQRDSLISVPLTTHEHRTIFIVIRIAPFLPRLYILTTALLYLPSIVSIILFGIILRSGLGTIIRKVDE